MIAARTPIDAQASANWVTSTARNAGIRKAAGSVVRVTAAALPFSANGVERSATIATEPATASVPA